MKKMQKEKSSDDSLINIGQWHTYQVDEVIDLRLSYFFIGFICALNKGQVIGKGSFILVILQSRFIQGGKRSTAASITLILGFLLEICSVKWWLNSNEMTFPYQIKIFPFDWK